MQKGLFSPCCCKTSARTAKRGNKIKTLLENILLNIAKYTFPFNPPHHWEGHVLSRELHTPPVIKRSQTGEGFYNKIFYCLSVSYDWWMQLSRSRRGECTLWMKLIWANANLAGYNWAWMNAVSLSSNLHTQDIPSLRWYHQFSVCYLNKRAVILYFMNEKVPV